MSSPREFVFTKITDPLVDNMLRLINLDDDDLLDPKKRTDVSAVFGPSK